MVLGCVLVSLGEWARRAHRNAFLTILIQRKEAAVKLQSEKVTEHRNSTPQAALEPFGAGRDEAVLVPGACSCCCGAVVRK